MAKPLPLSQVYLLNSFNEQGFTVPQNLLKKQNPEKSAQCNILSVDGEQLVVANPLVSLKSLSFSSTLLGFHKKYSKLDVQKKSTEHSNIVQKVPKKEDMLKKMYVKQNN